MICYAIVPVFTRQTHSESPLLLFFPEKFLICLSKGLSHHFIKKSRILNFICPTIVSGLVLNTKINGVQLYTKNEVFGHGLL